MIARRSRSDFPIRTMDGVSMAVRMDSLLHFSEFLKTGWMGRAQSGSDPSSQQIGPDGSCATEETELEVHSHSVELIQRFADWYAPQEGQEPRQVPPSTEIEMKHYTFSEWDESLFADCSVEQLLYLLCATDFLDIPSLYWLAMRTTSDRLKLIEDPAEIRRLTGQPESAALSPEVEKALIESLGWLAR